MVHRAQEGFTLLEVIVVLAIISIFAGVVGTVIGTTVQNSEIDASEDRMKAVTEALLSYYADTDRFPEATGDGEYDLAGLARDPGVFGWRGPYITSGFEGNDFAKDAWKRSFEYDCKPGGSTCTIRSSGPDGIPENADDMAITVDGTAVYGRKIRRVRCELEVVKLAAQSYAADHGGNYPDGIRALFDGGYLSDESYRRDEWLVEYRAEGNQFVSLGPDRSPGGGDDIYPY
jgi:general secretion pathway protein G